MRKLVAVGLLLVGLSVAAASAEAHGHEPKDWINTDEPLEPRCSPGAATPFQVDTKGYVCTGPCELGAGPFWMRVYCV